nr:lecithin retinol acyltransferase family protein [uncultured Undibacterium sp.]
MAISSYINVKLDQISQNYAGKKKRTPKLGDHLIAARTGYTHHGIYIGNGDVIHYSGFHDGLNSGPVIKTSILEFANKGHLMVNVLPERKYDPAESIVRAFSKLGEAKYNLASNNCEHFVNWCIHGRRTSKQVEEAARLLCSPILISNLANLHVSSTILRSTSSMIARQSKGIMIDRLSRSAALGLASNFARRTPIAVGSAIGSSIKKVWNLVAD